MSSGRRYIVRDEQGVFYAVDLERKPTPLRLIATAETEQDALDIVQVCNSANDIASAMSAIVKARNVLAASIEMDPFGLPEPRSSHLP